MPAPPRSIRAIVVDAVLDVDIRAEAVARLKEEIFDDAVPSPLKSIRAMPSQRKGSIWKVSLVSCSSMPFLMSTSSPSRRRCASPRIICVPANADEAHQAGVERRKAGLVVCVNGLGARGLLAVNGDVCAESRERTSSSKEPRLNTVMWRMMSVSSRDKMFGKKCRRICRQKPTTSGGASESSCQACGEVRSRK